MENIEKLMLDKIIELGEENGGLQYENRKLKEEISRLRSQFTKAELKLEDMPKKDETEILFEKIARNGGNYSDVIFKIIADQVDKK